MWRERRRSPERQASVKPVSRQPAEDTGRSEWVNERMARYRQLRNRLPITFKNTDRPHTVVTQWTQLPMRRVVDSGCNHHFSIYCSPV